MDRAHPKTSEHMSNDLSSAATGRALGIYNQMQPCDEDTLTKARKIISEQIDRLIDTGESDEQRLVVKALAHLKALDREHAADNTHAASA
jgi:hypothetical protein